MYPTLLELDLLEVEPYANRPMRAGDVILFHSPEGGHAVHRVVKVAPKGIRTRGDNNRRLDPWAIHPEMVIGKVIKAHTGERSRTIYGGRVGWLWAFALKGVKMAAQAWSSFYHSLAELGLLRRLFPLHKRMKIICLRRKGEKGYKLLLGDQVIGYYHQGMPYWHIRRPFRLFIDQGSLPP